MRERWPLASLVLLAGVCAAPAADEPVKKAADFRPRTVRRTGLRFREDIEKWVKSFALPKDVEKKLIADLKRQRQEQEAMEKAHARQAKELGEQSAELRKRQDELRKEMERMRAEQAKLGRGGDVETASLITEEQLRDWESHKLARRLLHTYRGAHLTAEQQDKLRSLCDVEAKRLLKAAPSERDQADPQAVQKIEQGVDRLLTVAQRETMETQRLEDGAVELFQGIRLTNEQYEKIHALCAEAVRRLTLKPTAEAAASADWTKLHVRRGEIKGEIAEKIRRDVLTREQHKQIEEARKAREARGGKPSGR